MTLTTSANAAVNMELLRTATQRSIIRGIGALWPGKGVVFGQQCPSVTSYVCRVTVDGEELIAKYSWLGMSLVSILRGAGGTWEEVREAQRAYVRSGALLTVREARNLELLRGFGRPRVCETAGLSAGVLFTRPVAGVPLADEVAARPGDTDALLDAALLAVGDLHGPAGAEALGDAIPIGERSVTGVFHRKFGGAGAAGYLAGLGRESGLPEEERQEIARLVRITVWRLLQMARTLPARQPTAVYGDLKPEHVYVDGPCLRFIDPAVQWAAGPQTDVAKLTGRTLLLALGLPERRAGRQIVQGVASTLGRQFPGLLEQERAVRLREVVVLWLMDTVNILTTCLSAPLELPLAFHQQVLVARAREVAGIVALVSAVLVGTMDGPRALDTMFSEVESAVGGAR